MPKQKLFDEDSADEVTFKTENEYAKKYDSWREKEELHKCEESNLSSLSCFRKPEV